MKKLWAWEPGPGLIAGLLGTALGIAVVLVALAVDARGVHSQLYSAIAAALPIFLLAVLVHVRNGGAYLDALARQRAEDQTELAQLFADLVVARLEPSAPDPKADELASRAAAALGRLNQRAESSGALRRLRLLLYLTFAATAIGEVASLVALGSGRSTFLTLVFAAGSILTLFLILVLMESDALMQGAEERRSGAEAERARIKAGISKTADGESPERGD